MFIRVYVPRCLYNLTLQLVQRAIKCICWKGHCLEDWTCFTALVENYIKLCPSDRSPSEGKSACQIMWWVITRTWTRVCFRRFREQIRGCKPNSAPPPLFFILKSATHVISKWYSQTTSSLLQPQEARYLSVQREHSSLPLFLSALSICSSSTNSLPRFILWSLLGNAKM